MNRLSYVCCGLLLLLVGRFLPAKAQQSDAFPVQVQTTKGSIEGLYHSARDGIQYYLGIPYAKPPVGDLRWQPPQPMDPWEGVIETKAFGPRAIQTDVFGDMKFRSNGLSEDCLYLNVWTPAKRNSTDLPVLVYFYGGGFVAGDGSEPRYDGEAMAKQGMVVVTVNYRLNIFGFLAHPALSAASPYGGSGNYGLLDQQAALQWVQDNIAAFGGDPDRVTIAGESAGSISVSIQMASPLSRDLIAGAIGESGASIHPTLAPTSLQEAEQIGAEFVQAAGFADFAEFRQLSTAEIFEIFNASGRFGFPVVVDGYLLPKTLPEIFAAGEQAQVPLLAGWNSAEIPGQAFMYGQPYAPENFRARVMDTYPEQHEEVLALYAHGDSAEVAYSATDLASDRFISYSTWKWLDLHARHSEQPVYRYLFSRIRPPLRDETLVSGLAGGTMQRDDAPPQPQPIGAPHATEIEYCLGNLPLVDDFAWTEADYQVSETMMRYFANFIKTGDPNDENLPTWPTLDPEAEQPAVLNIDVDSKVIRTAHEARYHFHDRYYGNQ